MNKVYRYIVAALSSAALCACVKVVDAPVPNERPDRPEGPAIVDGVFEVTRMAMTNANVNWIDGCEALVSDGIQETPATYVSEGSKGLKTVLKGELSSKADLFYIAYPASGCKSLADGFATFEIPAEQTAGPQGESLCLPATAFTALPKANAVNNAAAIVLNIPADNIRSLKVSTANGEQITGTIDVDIYSKEVSVKESASSSVTVKPSGENFQPGTVTIAVVPATVSGGFKVEAESSDGQVSTSWFRGEYELEVARALVLGEVNRPLAEEVAFEARAEGQTSSTLTVSWSPSNYSDAAADVAIPYSFALYKDAACQDLHVQFYTPASLSNWEKRHPKFIFTGLEPNTSYWFKAVREDYSAETLQTSNVLELKTLESKVVADATSGNEGDIILSEDFSELLWFGDGVGQAMGYINVPAFRDAALTTNPGPALGEANDESRVTFVSYGNESRLYSKMAAAVSGTRLAKWGQINEGSSNLVCLRPGYLKLGAESRIGTLVTPELNSLQEGKYTDLEVTFKAARYESDPLEARVVAVSGEMDESNTIASPAYGKSYRFKLNGESGWNEYTLVVKSVQKGQRIAIGMDREANGSTAGAKQMRMYIDDISVKVLKINDNPELTEPELSAKARFTDATVSWLPVTGASAYRISLNGTQLADQSETSYYLTGLDMNTEYTLKVEAYDRTQEASSEISFKTRNVWQVKGRNQGCRMATFQWDPLEADYGGIDINGNKRLYEMAIYSDAACQNLVYTCYPYNGYASTNTAFANSSWLGKYTNANGGVSNRVYDTRITFGSLKPATTYWFRVRSLEQYTITYHGTGSNKTMSNPAGTSEWSKALEFTTPARHTLASNEVIYCGFDDFCVQMDYGNGCVGTTPATTSRNGYAAAVANGANHWTGNFCTYEFAIGGHQPDTWGFASGAKYIDGSQNPTPTQSCVKCNANAGDAADWYMSPQTRPMMGAVLLDGDRRWVATPGMESSLLKDDQTTACTLSFTYIGISNSPSTFAQKLEIRQYNPSAIYDGQTYKVVGNVVLEPPYVEGKAATNNDFTSDYSGVSVSIDVDLYKGESLMIVNTTTGGVYRLVIDDIKVVTK